MKGLSVPDKRDQYRAEGAMPHAAVLPGEGSELLCADPACGHIDCDAWRSVLHTACPVCGGTLEPGEEVAGTFHMAVQAITDVRHASHDSDGSPPPSSPSP